MQTEEITLNTNEEAVSTTGHPSRDRRPPSSGAITRGSFLRWIRQGARRLAPPPGVRWGTWLAERIIVVSGVFAIVVVLLIFFFLLKDGVQTFRYVSVRDFLLGPNWYPLDEEFGTLPLILGSLYVTLGAVVVAVPLGVACALYLAEVARPAVREMLKPAIEVLAGIPSVVVGFIGLLVVAPMVKNAFNLPTGLTGLTGSILLAFMALPTIISISEDSLTAVPRAYRLGALALGATRWQALRGVVLPAARSGIIAAVMLGIGRAIGETMTVLMVTGNAAVLPKTLLQPLRTMTATIAQEMGETVQFSSHYYALFGIGLVLFLISFAINLIADVALHRVPGGKR
ncbi:MAG: phosphate ABC transporter permease subunit PstC [Armatimonadota bacterium]|nr:phosphate ABC transporter permease subunit PstC [Armatimonadota bacterium]